MSIAEIASRVGRRLVDASVVVAAATAAPLAAQNAPATVHITVVTDFAIIYDKARVVVQSDWV